MEMETNNEFHTTTNEGIHALDERTWKTVQEYNSLPEKINNCRNYRHFKLTIIKCVYNLLRQV